MKILNSVIRLCLTLLFSCGIYAQDPDITVAIQGLNKEMEENVRSHLSLLQEYAKEGTLLPAQYEDRAKQEILTALQPYGYYDANVRSHLRIDHKTWHASFVVSLNSPVRVKAIHFHIIGEGETDPALQGLLKDFPLSIGDIFIHERYEQGKKAILSQVIQRGYLNAIFSEHRVEVDPPRYTSEIYLTLSTGARHVFGKVTFSPTVLSESFLERYLPFRPGEVYSPEKLAKLQSYLSQSDYFSQVNIRSQSDEDATVPIIVELSDIKPNQYVLGAGYGTDTGVRGKLGWTRRRINSLGHRFQAEAQIAEVYNKLHAEYIIPGKKPQTDIIKFQGGFFEEEFSEKRSQIYETGIIEERDLSGWQRRLAINFQHERFNAFITNDRVESRLILPSLTFIQVKRHDPNLNLSSNGRRIEISFRGAIDALFSSTTFFQTYLQLKWLHTLSDSIKLLTRAEFGFTLPDDIDHLPLSQRFFAGGDLSLRGYGYRTLPNEIDKHGIRHPVGGPYLAVGSIELAKTIKKPIGIFTFVDAGNAYRKLFDETAIGAGVGIEWQTKLGPIKFAIAKPLTKSSDSWRIHASFGPEL